MKFYKKMFNISDFNMFGKTIFASPNKLLCRKYKYLETSSTFTYCLSLLEFNNYFHYSTFQSSEKYFSSLLESPFSRLPYKVLLFFKLALHFATGLFSSYGKYPFLLPISNRRLSKIWICKQRCKRTQYHNLSNETKRNQLKKAKRTSNKNQKIPKKLNDFSLIFIISSGFTDSFCLFLWKNSISDPLTKNSVK